MSLEITSTAFAAGSEIPARYTCEGEDLSPPLAWTGAPEGTRSFALICDDPDAPVGVWVHWVLYDLPSDAAALSEGTLARNKPPEGGTQGVNDFRNVGYGGPCPPPGKPHRYFFKLYALGTQVDLAPRATKRELERAMEGHVLAEAELMGMYAR